MSNAVAVLFKILNARVTQRVARLLFAVLLFFWLVDRAVFALTDWQWFREVGARDLLLNQWQAQLNAFGFIVLPCLVLSILVMRVLKRPAGNQDTLPLPGKLNQLEPLRTTSRRWSWSFLLLSALLLGWGDARQWMEWLPRDGSKPVGFTVPFYGLDAGFWLNTLPFLNYIVGALWTFSIELLLICLTSGVLQVLPWLATKRPQLPARAAKGFWRLIAWILLLRAAGYGLYFFQVAVDRWDAAGLFLSRPLSVLGALGCIMAAAAALAIPRVPQERYWKASRKFVFQAALVLILPVFLDLFLSPLANLVLPDSGIQKARVAATRRAWQLDFKEYRPGQVPPPERQWPVWDEAHLLRAMATQRGSGSKIIRWKSGRLHPAGSTDEPDNWKVTVVGEPAGAQPLNAGRVADGNTAISLAAGVLSRDRNLAPDLDTISLVKPPFYGFEGRALLDDADRARRSSEWIGISLGSIRRRLLWAWRLRDAYILFEAPSSSDLLVFRGVEERARKLMPHLVPAGDPIPVLNESEGRLYWHLTLLEARRNFPGSTAPKEGKLSWYNSVQPATTILWMDAHSGQMSLEGIADTTHKGTKAGHSIWESLPSQSSLTAPDIYPATLEDAQAQVFAQLDGGTLISNGVPLHTGDVSIISSPTQDHLLLSSGSELSHWSTPGTVGKRVEQLIQALNKKIPPAGDQSLSQRGVTTEAGEPVVWPDPAAPGGWWAAMTYYEVPLTDMPNAPEANRKLSVFRVAIAGATGPIGVGQTWSEALAEWQTQQPSNVAVNPATSIEQLAARALRLHDLAEAAVRRQDYAEYGRLNRDERKILEQIARGKAAPNAQP